MTAGRTLTRDEFLSQLCRIRHSARRLELQRSYAEPGEDALYASWLDGDPRDPEAEPEFIEWFAIVRAHVAADRQVERVRVHDEPPTNFQRYLRWLDPWNRRAGENISYLTREQAHEIGLLPAAGAIDWWLLDGRRLLAMHFNDTGNRVRTELVEDPEAVVQACRWWDLAVRHSTPTSTGAAA